MPGRDLFDALIRTTHRHRPRPEPLVERLVRPSMERFEVFRRAARPVVLQGLLDEAQRAEYWSLPSLRARFADRIVSVIPTDQGRISLDVRTGVDFDTVRFGDYVDALARGERPEAYVAVPADTWMPEITDRVGAPPYCRDAAWRNSRFWLGAHTSVPLHRDVAENVFFQLMGRKRFYIYPPAASAWLYSNPLRSALPNFSRFDPEAPDYDRFPLSRAVTPIEVILGPGDALYLPSRWWHQVRALEVSASLNYWFADGLLAYIVRAAELVKRTRGLEIYGLEARRNAPGESPRQPTETLGEPPIPATSPAARAAADMPSRRDDAPGAPPPVEAGFVSCIMPAYNERDGIRAAVEHLRRAAERVTSGFEIIVVDDGSTDGTGQVLDALADQTVRVIRLAENAGYGGALRAGFAAAAHPLVFFTDSDDQFDPLDLERLLPLIGEADMVVGYRVGRRDGALRAVLSRGYNRLMRGLLGIGVRDINCAFKLVRRDVLANLRLVSDGYTINAEMLVRAHAQGYRVREVPVGHRPRLSGESKVGLSQIPRSLWQVYKLGRALREWNVKDALADET